ncbi:MAG: MFS transporter [Acidobacteria bacterium]|nr:MFS transporter [Bacteroidota bacterium]MBS1766474.1 MFS transporter [Acidobacteriota bacterium]
MEEGSNRWLNRAVWGMAWTSFLSDLGHEAMSAILPAFLAALGLPPAALGAVEGAGDAAASFMKLGAGWVSDRLGRRKGLVVAGYLATGLASGFVAMASGFGGVLASKAFGWTGRGLRGPLRDAMLTDAIPADARGRAFGFHRAGDTVGAILGPALAAILIPLGTGLPWLRMLLGWTLVPGVLAAAVFAWAVPERARAHPSRLAFRDALKAMPSAFRDYLAGVGLFGCGDFAHTLLILAAAQLLAPGLGAARAAAAGVALYALHNAVYALSAFPAGALADRFRLHRRLLGWGYLAGAIMPVMLAAAFLQGHASLLLMAGIFALGGFVNGLQDTLEGAATAELAPQEHRGLAFGLLGAVNGAGDLLSSLGVGLLWTWHPAAAFFAAAGLMAAGGLWMARKP